MNRVATDRSVDGLIDLHARPSLAAYVLALWRGREFAFAVARRDFRARNMNNVLGLAWFLLTPALSIAVYFVFFGLVLRSDRGVDNFLIFLATGVLTYQYLQRTVTQISRSLTSNIGIIRALRFPRGLLPLSDALGQFFAQIPVLIVLVAFALSTGVEPRLTWLLLLPLTIPQACFGLGFGMVLARLTTVVRDLQSFLPTMFRLVFYSSGIFFSVVEYVEDGPWRALFSVNPFYDYIETMRWAISGDPVSGWTLIGFVFWTFAALPIGLVVFFRGEPYGRT